MSSFTNSDHYQALTDLLHSEAESFSFKGNALSYHCLMGMALDFVWHHQLDVTVRDIKDIVGDVLFSPLESMGNDPYIDPEYWTEAQDDGYNVVDFHQYISSMAG